MASNGPVTIDLIHEISLMFIRILLKCAIGEELDGVMVDYYENGVKGQKDIPYSLRNTFQIMISRTQQLHTIAFPRLAKYHIVQYERDVRDNAKAIRALFEKMVIKRKALIKDSPQDENLKKDLLGILLSNPATANDDEMIIDECLTFFFAGS
jgi:cytochrome P450